MESPPHDNEMSTISEVDVVHTVLSKRIVQHNVQICHEISLIAKYLGTIVKHNIGCLLGRGMGGHDCSIKRYYRLSAMCSYFSRKI